MNQPKSFAGSQSNLPGQDTIRENAGSLRNSFEKERCEYNAKQVADIGKTEAERRKESTEIAERRESFMVKRQQPAPVLRPSPELAHGSDRATFNQRWEQEGKAAEQDREARKQAFKELRTTQAEFTREHSRARPPQSQARG